MSAAPGWGRSPEDIAAEIEMVRTNWAGDFLLVEGATDERFFIPRVATSVYIVQAGGRTNVERTLEIVDADASLSASGIVGVVDEDYDWLAGYVPRSSRVVKFDPRDLEAMLIQSNALDSVLAEYSDPAAVATFLATTGSTIRDELASRAKLFGLIRMHNSQNASVCLKQLKPSRFCNRTAWTYDELAVLEEAVRLGVHHDRNLLKAEIAAYSPPTIWHCVRGHDLVDILVGGLIGVLGGGGGVTTKAVDALLRQAVSDAHFRSTGFFTRFGHWAAANGKSYFR